MPEPSASSSPALATTPRVFCKGCGYALVGLESNKCPECGRGFDLGNRRTFARRPPRSWVWRWGRRVLALLLLLLLTAGTGVGWLWWGWRAEQPTIARLRTAPQQVHVRSIGPERLRRVLGDRLGYLTDRVNSAFVRSLGGAEIEQLDLPSLTHIEKLTLSGCELRHSHLSQLAGLQQLQELLLFDLKIEKPDLAFLEKLPALSKLFLRGKWVAEAGFEHLTGARRLKELSLPETGMADADLQHLRGLSSLEELDIRRNPISDDGLEYLQGLKSLRVLWLDGTAVTSSGVAKLKQAVPRLLPIGGGRWWRRSEQPLPQ
jgi:hypothetical protein